MNTHAAGVTTGRDDMSTATAFTYDGEQTREISFPLGGIGTGCIGLSGAGRLVDWEVLNRPAKGITNGLSHFAVRAERDGQLVDARILNGPYLGNRTGDFPADTSRNFGFGARRDSLVGMPHFAHNTFRGRFPTAELRFTDPHFPGAVDLLAFNPFIPMDERDSSLPAAMFEMTFHNPGPDALDCTAVGVLGHGLRPPTTGSLVTSGELTGVQATTDEADRAEPDYAELVLATDADTTSHQVHLFRGHWFDPLEVYWKDLMRPGPFAPRDYGTSDLAPGMGRNRDSGLVAAHVRVPAGESRAVRFVIAWYAPNFRKYWVSPLWHFRQASAASGHWRNWYATEWPDAAAVAREALTRWDELFDATSAFRDALYDSTLPTAVIDAAGANLSVLKSPTSLRLEDGTFYGWEGCHPGAGSCEGSCTHVWNYQQALPFLFPALERSMRVADYTYNQDDFGGMSFRLSLPLGTANTTERPCADGQLGGILKLYRDWKLGGDLDWLRELWPAAQRSLEYAWSPDNLDRWDPKQTGVLWGRQHHTLDMELFGPNSWLTSFYLGALAAAAEMADALGDAAAAELYRAIGEQGRAWVSTNLFNGEYFVQRLDLGDRSVLRPYAHSELQAGVLGDGVEALYWSAEHGELKYQLGEGSIIDQVLGQWHASLYGLGDVLDPEQVALALRAIYRYNFKPRLGEVPNPCRVFGLYDESGTIVAAWPPGVPKPAVPVPYAQETMHGMEYAFAQMLMLNGALAEGVRVVAAVRERYDGALRNPWNEIECGSNYARSMASWGAVPILSGFSFDATRGHLGWAPLVRGRDGFRGIWSGPGAWGTVEIREGTADIAVLGGSLSLTSLALPLTDDGPVGVMFGDRTFDASCHGGVIAFDPIRLEAGMVMAIDATGLSVAALPEAGAVTERSQAFAAQETADAASRGARWPAAPVGMEA
jgi:uncharacterized protein (DUF608 family)